MSEIIVLNMLIGDEKIKLFITFKLTSNCHNPKKLITINNLKMNIIIFSFFKFFIYFKCSSLYIFINILPY